MITIPVKARDFTVKAKQLRRSGLVPGSVYGGPLTEDISLQLDYAEVQKLVREKWKGSRINLDLDGRIIPVQIKDADFDPLGRTMLDISFEALKADVKVNSVVHILLKNVDKLPAPPERLLTEIPYDALPKDMIDTITLDLDGMPIGTIITVADLPELQNEALELQVPSDEIVLRILDKKRVGTDTSEDEEET